MTEKVFIGTSGWNYKMWQGVFYPEKLASKDYLNYYSKFFNTVEINSSFYHFPRETSYKNWYNRTMAGFVFSVKVHRSITHIKRFVDVEEEWKTFVKGVKILKEKLSVILFQFPSSFRCNEENLKRIEKFLDQVSGNETKLRFAFEFRHISWDNEEISNLLKSHNAGWVIANSSKYPEMEKITSDFVYIRMHGPEQLFASEYSTAQLRDLASKVKIWKKEMDVFVYFNNDFYGYAVKNAMKLVKLCQEAK
ncbi:MAG TPA: DUF72 domain-containing protein [bacterium]|nr:DUF72 domain-containing protein [bacterium]HOL35567.1 DUF72 domain-containing protein [bacterium]HPP08777.1 DUF72 domain-containing protein [bacterium]